jgi:hypothetical protein
MEKVETNIVAQHKRTFGIFTKREQARRKPLQFTIPPDEDLCIQ